MKAQISIADKNISIDCNQIVYNGYGGRASFTIWLGRDYSLIDKELDSKLDIKYNKKLNEYYIKPETKFISISE